MYVVFLIFLSLLLIITFPLYLGLDFRFNINAKQGHIIIKFFKITIINYMIKLKNRKIILYNKKEVKKLDFEINKENINFANLLQKELFKRIFLDKIIIKIDFGINNNPFLVALIYGTVNTFLNIFFGIISYQKPTSKLNYDLNTYNDKNLGILNLNIYLSISLLNMFFAYVKAKKNLNNKKKKESLTVERKPRTNI